MERLVLLVLRVKGVFAVARCWGRGCKLVVCLKGGGGGVTFGYEVV